MKYLFVVLAIILGAASFGTYLSLPDLASEVPVIYWVTDRNPAREKQVELFHQWLVKQGHVTPEGLPVVQLRLDTSNAEPAKKIIQSVSGIGGDIMDTGGVQMRLFQRMNIIEDVTEPAKRLAFDPSMTYKAMEPEITIDGRQYVFPCNVYAQMVWVNKAAFERVGMPLPPQRWTLDEFEKMGLAFVEKANEGRRVGDRVFFIESLNPTQMIRGMGLSVYNETLTACDLDDPRYVEYLTKVRKWTYEDHLMPTPDDRASFDVAAGYGGLGPQLFNSGNLAMMISGRYMLIQFRKFPDSLQLAVVEPPHGGYPNTLIGTRAASVYAGGKHKDLAALFLAYLASEDYNMQIVDDADALPPNPRYAQTEQFRHPPQYPNEWEVHEPFYNAAQTIAIATTYSPFVLGSEVQREIEWYKALHDNHKISAQEAARETARAVDHRIAGELSRNPALQPEYDRLVEVQKQIDQRLESGQKLPKAWVLNPFYLRYYTDLGMIEESGRATAAEAASASDL